MSDPTTPDEERGLVLRFRPRGAPHGGWRWRPTEPEDDFAQYERTDPHEDHRHRMFMNVLAIAVILVLMGCGMWLAAKLVEMRDQQDCVLSGRTNCAPIAVPTKSAR
jgi:hypothetical protein